MRFDSLSPFTFNLRFPLNLLLINYEYPPIGGGAANATWHLAKALKELGHQVTVLTAAYKDLSGWRNENGVNVFRCRAVRKHRATSTIFEMASFVIFAALRLPKIVNDRKIEGIIVFFLFPCGPLGLIPYYLYRIPFVISLRGGDVPGNEPGLTCIHRLLAPVRRLVYRKSISVVANSNGLKNIARKSDPVKIQVIPNGVDTVFFHPLPPGHANPEPVFHLLYVGRFQPEKNLPFLFIGLSLLLGKTAESFVIHMVGDGPQKKELIWLAQTLGLSDRIVWHAWFKPNDLKAMYRMVDCLVLTSRYEGMSNVILEAMACGLPVLASRVGGNIDLIQEGRTGLLFDLQSQWSFCNAIAAMIGNRKKTKQMGLNARQFVCGHLNWTQIAEQYLARLSTGSDRFHADV